MFIASDYYFQYKNVIVGQTEIPQQQLQQQPQPTTTTTTKT